MQYRCGCSRGVGAMRAKGGGGRRGVGYHIRLLSGGEIATHYRRCGTAFNVIVVVDKIVASAKR